MKLNFGSGTKYLEGWHNVDGGEHLKPQGHRVDQMFRFDEFPYPLKSDVYDIIISMHVLEHVSWRKQQLVLEELLRVAKPGCELLIEVPSLEGLFNQFSNGFADSDGKFFNTHLNREQSKKERFLSTLLGGQAHDEDFHIGTLWRERLEELLINSGWKVAEVKIQDEVLIAECRKK